MSVELVPMYRRASKRWAGHLLHYGLKIQGEFTARVEKQMDKKMGKEMETGIIQ